MQILVISQASMPLYSACTESGGRWSFPVKSTSGDPSEWNFVPPRVREQCSPISYQLERKGSSQRHISFGGGKLAFQFRSVIDSM